MKKKPTPPVFDFTVMLSFNELAWIGVFSVGLFCAFTFVATQKRLKILNPPVIPGPGPGLGIDRDAEIKRLKGEVDRLTKDLARVNVELDQAKAQNARLTRDLTSEEAARRALEQQLATLTKERDALLGRLRQAAAEIDRLQKLDIANQAEIARLKRIIAELTPPMPGPKLPPGPVAPPAPVPNVPRQLLGLGGAVNNVVFLIDRSGSMDEYWKDNLDIIRIWLAHLPVKSAAIIAFDGAIRSAPADPKNGLVRIENNEAMRRALLREVDELGKPGGWGTNMHKAFEEAYKYPGIDTIILFGDGDPRPSMQLPQGGLPYNEANAYKLRKAVLDLAESRPDVAVNIVAIGGFDEIAYPTAQSNQTPNPEFLLQLARGLPGGSRATQNPGTVIALPNRYKTPARR